MDFYNQNNLDAHEKISSKMWEPNLTTPLTKVMELPERNILPDPIRINRRGYLSRGTIPKAGVGEQSRIEGVKYEHLALGEDLQGWYSYLQNFSETREQ